MPDPSQNPCILWGGVGLIKACLRVNPKSLTPTQKPLQKSVSLFAGVPAVCGQTTVRYGFQELSLVGGASMSYAMLKHVYECIQKA